MTGDSFAPSAGSTAMRKTGRAIDAAASEWVVKIDRRLTSAEQAALETWLAGDTRCIGALARAQAGWMYVERARGFRPARELRESRTERRWRMARPWAAAAAVLLCLATTALIWQRYALTHLVTSLGEVRRASLADGSHVTLDTRSRVSVRYESSTRFVVLESGEALFEVAKNSKRPFVVQAGDFRVRAVGTAFMVRRRSDDDIDITVTQGTVDVWRQASSPEPAVRLSAGTHTTATPKEIAPPAQLTAAQLTEATDWVTEVIDLNGRTLGQAAAEFNRYNRQAVVIADPELAAETVVGRFQATDPNAFVKAAAAMLGANARTDGDHLILEPRPGRKK
jgi:transmembrane sensor